MSQFPRVVPILPWLHMGGTEPLASRATVCPLPPLWELGN